VSSRLRRLLCFGLTLFAVATAESSWAQSGHPPLALAAAKAVLDRMDANAEMSATYGACPADSFRRATAQTAAHLLAAKPTLAQCAADPESCHAACLGGQGSACFALARAFQENEQVAPPYAAQKLFSMACSYGYGAGCTNRAANLRNNLSENDPLRALAKRAREACQFRTFRIACQESDAWGCAMLGQSYQYGEGVNRSPPRARGAFDKACRLAPDFEACSFAKDGAARLTNHQD
jgi:TPR repeat protein